jgi:hypothetical protein
MQIITAAALAAGLPEGRVTDVSAADNPPIGGIGILGMPEHQRNLGLGFLCVVP